MARPLWTDRSGDYQKDLGIMMEICTELIADYGARIGKENLMKRLFEAEVQMDVIEVPDICPKCYSKVLAFTYKPVLRILSKRSYRCCQNQDCDFEESNKEYQDRMGFGSV